MDKDVNNVISLASYRDRKPVIRLIDCPMSALKDTVFAAFFNESINDTYVDRRVLQAIISNGYLAFAHVLNIPESEDIWPGDAAELFYPELFACELSDGEYVRVLNGAVYEHMRCETLRLCYASFLGNDYFEYDFDRFRDGGSFPLTLFGDERDDEVVFDSVLLLTQEYLPPEELLFGKKPTDG